VGGRLKVKRIQLSNPHTLLPLNTEISATIEVNETKEKYSYAWYLYLNDNVIERKNYDVNNRTSVFKLREPGEYRLKGYVQNSAGTKVSSYSERFKVYSQRKYVKEETKPKLPYKELQLNYSELKSVSLTEKNATIYSINKDNYKYEFLIKPKPKSNKNKLIVMASGAYDAQKGLLPNLQRHSWMDEIDGNVIYFNDPTLYLKKMNLGWGQGTEDIFFLENISKMIEVFAHKMSVLNENILFYGSSAGGFMSLVLGGYVKKSSVLINNPQTIVPNYYKSPVIQMYEASYEGFSNNEIEKRFKNRLDIRAFYSEINYVPNIYYLQNAACKNDMSQHYLPFNDFMYSNLEKQLDGNFISHLYWDEEAQHNPLDKQTTLDFINKVSNMWIE